MTDQNADTGSVVAERSDGHTDQTAREIDARVYRVLGEQFLARPDRERVDAVGIWASEWRGNAERLPPEFDAALERIEDGATADAETLRTAYTHLFRGVSERAPDPPTSRCTSTELLQRDDYRDPERLPLGRPRRRRRGRQRAPDHLGLELQFLGELVAMDDGDRDPDEPDLDDALWWLLDEHLTEWLPTYHARIRREEPHEYYGGLLDLR
ncbi:molecular chaperone [Halosimplex aquaticum]